MNSEKTQKRETKSSPAAKSLHRLIARRLRIKGRNRMKSGDSCVSEPLADRVVDDGPAATTRLMSMAWAAPMIIFIMIAVLGCENEQKIQRSVVSGTVLDTAGNRIVGAHVTSHRSLYEAMTDQGGRYAFTSLDTGSQQLLVERDGYESASRTLSVDSGLVYDGIDFKLAPLADRLSWSIFQRDNESVTIDVTAKEPMACTAVYQGEHLPQLRTPPSPIAKESRFVIALPRPDITYQLYIEGLTSDGRRYVSASGSFRPVPIGVTPGGPSAPTDVSVLQTRDGPKLSWNYDGVDTLRGFRIYRAEEDKQLTLWQEESFVFAGQRFLTDDQAEPGVLLRYAMQAVDLDGNLSSMTSEIRFIPAGELRRNVTWKTAWTSIDLFGDIQVPDQFTLTIEPGLVVRVASVDAAQGGLDPTKCELIVDGRIVVGASGSAPVQFMSATAQPARDNWSGMRLRTTRSTQGSEISNMEISNAEIGILAQDAPFIIGRLEARYCATGLLIQGASGTALSGLSFVDCGTGFAAENTLGCSLSGVVCRGGNVGIALRGDRFFTLSEFDIRDTLDTALEVDDTASPTVLRGLMTSKRLGMSVKGGNGQLQYLTVDAPNGVIIDGGEQANLRNVIIVNRTMPGTGNGLEEKTAGRAYLYDNIFGFKNATVSCTQTGAPIYNIDPRFVGGTNSALFDYSLKPDSPLKTASDKNGEIGAYGNP
ncbi:MAG: carboxypeptidase regulatory-like domain-containing protein [Candidatus Riflebacteria bacterium]|nr:carboxypeptidase regulatory-like domain-containing protein [Candidatus Riflebacteria bacterium]